MDNNELTEIIAKHRLWLDGDEGGERANLSGANLSGANLRGANLSDANLSDANLSDANLSDANLSDANLSDANLSDANLSDANLSDANLSDANLRDANLSDANLRGAYLSGCSGNRLEIKSIFASEIYPITYTAEYLQIGCERHPISDWWGFDDERILKMDSRRALEFWREWKDIIRTVIEKSPAKPAATEEPKESETAA